MPAQHVVRPEHPNGNGTRPARPAPGCDSDLVRFVGVNTRWDIAEKSGSIRFEEKNVGVKVTRGNPTIVEFTLPPQASGVNETLRASIGSDGHARVTSTAPHGGRSNQFRALKDALIAQGL